MLETWIWLSLYLQIACLVVLAQPSAGRMMPRGPMYMYGIQICHHCAYRWLSMWWRQAISRQSDDYMSHVFVWDLNLVITVPVDGLAPSGARPSTDTVYVYVWDPNLISTVPANGIIPTDFNPSAGMVMTTNLMYMYGTQIWSPLCLQMA